jgi:hypothetical protein
MTPFSQEKEPPTIPGRFTLAYYRLDRIDGAALPVDLEYGEARCVITDGDLVVRHDETSDGDGTISIRLFGTAFGLPEIGQIYLERYPFDRLDATHLTFPGGWRHRLGISPHSVVRYTDDGLDLAALNSDPAQRGTQHTFRPHRWSFVASEQRLPDSDAAAGSS